MKLSWKMILIFSVMMLATTLILVLYSAQNILESTNVYTSARFLNMGKSISKALDQHISMMELTAEELLDNTSFTAALNQMVRDDSEDQKLANAASNSVLQILYRSPLVNSHYRVTFYTREGLFVTSHVQRDDVLHSGTAAAKATISELPWLDDVDADPTRRHVLEPHPDFLALQRGAQVFGIIQAVTYHDKQLGYLEICSESTILNDMMRMVDEDSIMTQAVFDDGTVFYSDKRLSFICPDTLPTDTLSSYTDEKTGMNCSIMHVRCEWLSLNIYLVQDKAISEASQALVRQEIIRISFIVMACAIALVVVVSFSLTRSIRQLTSKVSHLKVEHVLNNQPDVTQALSATVISPQDAELHQLEKVFNAMMLHLRDRAQNELVLREGTLQAQLSALQTQINPHFIYNTLNIISAKSMENGNWEVIEICDQFARLLRYSTDTRSRAATLVEEIENVRCYLMLAKCRYEENLEFTIDIPEDITGIHIPKLTLQPLVENALNHGFTGNNDKRRLSITGKLEDNILSLEIRDNGAGFPEEILAALQEKLQQIQEGTVSINAASGHIGLINTCLRLHYYSQGAMRVTIRNENGAVVCLTMPSHQHHP